MLLLLLGRQRGIELCSSVCEGLIGLDLSGLIRGRSSRQLWSSSSSSGSWLRRALSISACSRSLFGLVVARA